MRRIYGDYAYGPGPRESCWWDETIAAPDWPALEGDTEADVAIIGGGFTGISAALHLAEAGVSTVLLEAETPGWGASGRNGGFCCIGGSRISEAQLAARVGETAAAEYWRAETDAVHFAAGLIDRLGLEVDRHSDGETLLAHRPKDMIRLRKMADDMSRQDGPAFELLEEPDLARAGLGGPFFGALTTRVGFGLNPRKYLFGLAAAAGSAGATLHSNTRVTAISPDAGGHLLFTAQGRVRARQVIIATNGYSSETLPPWLAGRYIPTQSNILVTRPLSGAELEAQGWTSDQASYDTRGLLHYFRLMPDRRFLFGVRGGLTSSPRAEARARARNRADFEAMFPAWAHVESDHAWSGMVCLSRNRVPFAGAVPGMSGVFAGLAYHGNGVAMGSFCGHLLADLLLGIKAPPSVMSTPMARFPFGRFRRLVLPPIYLARGLADL